MGAQRPAIRFKHEAMPVPVPRFGAGNVSGVMAYSTPYMMFWKKASSELSATCVSLSPLVVKTNSSIPVISVLNAIVPLRPICLTFTV